MIYINDQHKYLHMYWYGPTGQMPLLSSLDRTDQDLDGRANLPIHLNH